jgi:hypothetical protein
MARYHARNRRPFVDDDAIGAQLVANDRNGVGVVIGEQRADIDDRNPGAEPHKGLRQLATDHAAADDQQMIGQVGQVENRVVGEVRRVGQSGDRWNRGIGPGGNDEAPRCYVTIADGDRIRTSERGVAEDHLDAEAAEALGRIMRLDRRDRRGDRCPGAGPIDHGAGLAPRGDGDECL